MPENSFLSTPIYQEAVEEIRLRMDGASQRKLNMFGQTWFSKHFKMEDFGRTDSEFTAILGQMHAISSATLINRNSERPIRSLEGFGKVKAEMLTAAHTFKLEAEDIRAIALYQKLYPSAQDKQKVLDYIITKLMNVRERSIGGVQRSFDDMVLTLLSNDGQYAITADNNPGSPFVGTTLDFGFDPSHAGKVTTTWEAANKATVNVLEDLFAIRDAAAATGLVFTKMLMRQEQLAYMLTTDKLKLYINGSDKASRPITISDVNTLFAQYGLPEIEIVRHISQVEKDGGLTKTQYQPWKEGKILFVPSDNFGTIAHQLTDADLGMKSPGVEYSKYNGIEVTSWTQGIKEGTNYTEFVSAELTGTPVVDTIKDMYSLDVLHTAE